MNPHEIRVSKKLAELLPEDGIWLVDVKANHQIRLILMFLKALADLKRKRGLIVTLEKPHHYLTYLLGIHGITQRNITYVDVALSPRKHFKFPVSIEDPKIRVGGFLRRESVHPKDYEFMVIDNIGHTRMYLSEESHKRMARYLINEGKKNKIFTLFPLDRERCPKIYELIKKNASKEMKWEEVMKIAD